jgi:hypothetical protein
MDGIPASRSTIIPMIFDARDFRKYSPRNKAVENDNGRLIINAASDVI